MRKNLVTAIGRYEVVGLLATGGMAEVLLGRVRGPSGFERPVVIKRILPHLAREHEFRQMFLDEARIAARIRHPNVVAVEELGEQSDELYLVMEYLEGESLSTFGKLLKKQGEALPVALGAHVIAEVCAGLHAAHELKSADGESLGVVHRDVSPQNVFLLYDGHVKVIDFGIAKARTSESKTKTGHLKGKFSYMAPEQCKALPIDRRADVFALGILLWEITTGVRLFERDNDLLVFRAICEEDVPLPSKVVPGYPPALERICMKALAREPDDRYATAAAMRRDLTMALKELAGDEPVEDDLARLLARLFDDRIQRKKQMLATIERGERVAEVPPGEDSFRSATAAPQPHQLRGVGGEPPKAGADEAPEALTQAAASEVSSTHTSAVVSASEPQRPLQIRRSARWPYAVGAGAVVIGAALTIAIVAWKREAPSPAQTAAVEGSSSSAATSRSTIEVVPTPAASPAASAADATASASASASAAASGAVPQPTQAANKPAAGPNKKPPGPSAPSAAPSAKPTTSSTGFRRFD